jgi:hypothetical protein
VGREASRVSVDTVLGELSAKAATSGTTAGVERRKGRIKRKGFMHFTSIGQKPSREANICGFGRQ